MAGKINATLIVYDVPVGVKASPPDYLRSFGFSINLSCWVIPTSCVPRAVKYFEKLPASICWKIVHFDSMENENIAKMAVEALQKEAQTIRESMEKTVAKAVAKLDEIKNTFQDETKAVEVKRLQNTIKSRIKHAMKLLEKAEEAALRFDLMAEVEQAYKATAFGIQGYYQSWILEKREEAPAIAPDAEGPFAEDMPIPAEEITAEDIEDAMGDEPARFFQMESVTLSEEELANV